ncbi:MAG: hypothetical protein QUV05_06070 [Phycisphaerae bacterium]|nr:hypothetical protein [Phycisphaerae bacterium]
MRGIVGFEVTKRQTTYWELRKEETLIRVNFVGKEEFAFVDLSPSAYFFADKHPLLIDYEFPWERIYIGSRVSAFSRVRDRLAEAIESQFDGWRPACDYLNQFGSERVLHDGYGLLLTAPLPVSESCRAVLQDVGAQFSSIPERPSRWPRKAFIVGRNFVVAKAFRVVTIT